MNEQLINKTFAKHKRLFKESLQSGGWNENAEEALQKIKDVEGIVSQLHQKVSAATSNAGKKPLKKDLEPIWSDLIDAGHALQAAAKLLNQIWAPERKPAAGDWDNYYEPGRSAPQGPSPGWV